MNKARARVIRTVGALLLGVAIAAAPALTYAQHSGGGGGGGHMGGGGGHFSGGGGHVAGGAHFAGAPHAAYGGVRYAPGAHYGYAGGVHYGYGGRPGGYGWAGHPGAGWAPGNGYWHGGRYWAGGYWGGVFWPHVWFNPGYAWFLPVLPLGYATFWWAGSPYYYWNNLYYTWNPSYNGYVVTDPPPAGGQVDNSGDAGDTDYSGDAGGGYTQTPPPPTAPGPGAQPQQFAAPPAAAGAAADVYLYPRNGQSEAQTQNDRYECHSWAVGQTGFDPTRQAQQGGNAGDYKRAMIACLDARGYSAR